LTKLGTVQSLVKAYEVRLGRTSKVPEVPGAVASDPAIEQRYFSAFEEASAAIMRGGDLTPPSGQVHRQVPAAPAAAMTPTVPPFGPVQQRVLQQAGATLAKLTQKRLQLVEDHKTCSLVLRTAGSHEKAAAAGGLDQIARMIPAWQARVESILSGAYAFLPAIVLQANGSHEGMIYNAYRYLIEHVIVTASTELCGGVLSFGIASPLLSRLQSQLDVQHLLQQNDVTQAAMAAAGPPLIPPTFATTSAAGYSLMPDGTFEQYALPLSVGVAAARHAASSGGSGGGGGGGDGSPGAGGNGAGGYGGWGFGGGSAGL